MEMCQARKSFLFCYFCWEYVPAEMLTNHTFFQPFSIFPSFVRLIFFLTQITQTRTHKYTAFPSTPPDLFVFVSIPTFNVLQILFLTHKFVSYIYRFRRTAISNKTTLFLFLSQRRRWYLFRIWKIKYQQQTAHEYDEFQEERITNVMTKWSLAKCCKRIEEKIICVWCELGRENALEKKRKQSKHAKSHSIRSGNESGRTVKSTMSVTCKRFALKRRVNQREKWG